MDMIQAPKNIYRLLRDQSIIEPFKVFVLELGELIRGLDDVDKKRALLLEGADSPESNELTC